MLSGDSEHKPVYLVLNATRRQKAVDVAPVSRDPSRMFPDWKLSYKRLSSGGKLPHSVRRVHLILILLLSYLHSAEAQEAAFYNVDLFGPKPAVRFEQAKGVFHYVVPCKQYVSEDGPGQESAICWPVSARRLRMVDGKFDFSAFIPGILTISATQVRFIPQDAKDMAFWHSLPVSKVRLTEDPAKVTRYLESKEIGYKFGFLNYCEECDRSSSPLNPAKEAQLISEFQNVAEALIHFDVVYAKIAGLAREVRFTVALRNQPKLSDPRAAMIIYSNLNRSLAGLCPATVRPCIEEYAKYEACESSASSAGCGSPPACTATCTLPPATITSLKASECWGVPSSSATLIPSWEDVFRQEDADRVLASGEAKSGQAIAIGLGAAPKPYSWIPGPGWSTLVGTGASVPTIIDGYPLNQPDKACGVAQTYERLKTDHLRNLK